MTERIYLDNPYLRQMDARIIRKDYNNEKYFIVLDKTIFYPNLAGGQPGDKGTINGIPVIDTYEEDSQIVHVIKDNIYSDRVTLSIDWENRLNYMQQHSGQHLLSASFYKLFNAETIGFHLGHDFVSIDIDLPDLSTTIVNKVEDFANKIIFSNFPIEAYDDKLAKNSDSNANMRIVEIDGIDFTPCCGTHVRSTGEIGIIKIKDFKKQKASVKIEFVCGDRALKDYRSKSCYINNICKTYKKEENQILDWISEIEEENTQLKDQVYNLKKQILIQEIRSKKEIYKDRHFIKKSLGKLDQNLLIDLAKDLVKEPDHIVFLNSSQEETENYVFSLSPNLEPFFENRINLNIINQDPIIIQGETRANSLDSIVKDLFNRVMEKL